MPAPDDAYDRLPYTDHAYAEAHPDRLAVVARLAGWEPPDVAGARILELGCGRGGNLLAMAAALGGATLVGMDRSARQIDEARRIAHETALGHVTFVASAFESMPAPAPPFDFVLAHGLASWIAPEARRALLRAVARSLAPGGVAYVSFNVLPGWYERQAARDWLRQFARGPADARDSIEWLRDRVSPEHGAYRDALSRVAARLTETEVAYAAHEYLADEHHPQLVRDFLAEAEGAGLRYLGDAIPAATALELLPDDVAGRAAGLDVAGAQQLVDFVRNTAFRRALLVRADTCDARAWRWAPRLDATALDAMRVASRLRPHAGAAGATTAARAASAGAKLERFDAGDLSVQVSEPVARRALHELARLAPRSLPLRDLVSAAEAAQPETLARELLDLWLATGAIDLHVHEPPLAAAPGERPLACPVARWHAAKGGAITNRWHQEVRIDDRVVRWTLARLDGTRSAADLARELGRERFSAGLTDPELDAVVRASLEQLAAVALLLD